MSHPAKFALLLLLATFTLFLVAKDKKPIEWKTGTLLDMNTEHGSRFVEGIEARNDQSYYQIDDGEKYVYVVRRSMLHSRDKPLLLTVNAPIKFALDGDDHMLLQDEKGKEHRVSIEKKALRSKP